MFGKKQYLIDLVVNFADRPTVMPDGTPVKGAFYWHEIRDAENNLNGFASVKMNETNRNHLWKTSGKIIEDENNVVESEVKHDNRKWSDYRIFIPPGSQRYEMNMDSSKIKLSDLKLSESLEHKNYYKIIEYIRVGGFWKEVAYVEREKSTLPFGITIRLADGSEIAHAHNGPSERWAQVDIFREELSPLEILSIINAARLPVKGICDDCNNIMLRFDDVGYIETNVFECASCGRDVCKNCATKTGFMGTKKLCKTCTLAGK